MKRILGYIICMILAGGAPYQIFAIALPADSSQLPAGDLAQQDRIIADMAKAPAPSEKKIEYVSQVTRYGFKNLFSNYNYNSSLAYNVQVNPNAEQFIQDYMKVHGSYLQKMKQWGVPYFNFIEGVLKQYGLPKELKYIAVIESNLQNNAVSAKGACGPWQFMPETAQRWGLTINKYVDERTDFYKSTNAAARYLLSLYSQLNDWLLVMAAYNGGVGRVLSAIDKSKSRDFWKLQFYLPEESRTYVKRFIATHYIMEGTGGVTTITAPAVMLSDSLVYGDSYVNTTAYASAKGPNPYNLKPALSAHSGEVKQLTISGKYSGAIVARHLEMNILEFKQYNPAFDEVLATTGSYTLRLPPAKMDLFITDKYAILNESVQSLLGNMSIPTRTVYPKTHPVLPKKKIVTKK